MKSEIIPSVFFQVKMLQLKPFTDLELGPALVLDRS